MFDFQSEQRSFSIGDVQFGGQPGKRRTVMIGSLFYPGHSIVLDRKSGKIDQSRLDEVLQRLNAAIEETSTPTGIMVYAETGEAMRSHLERLSDLTHSPLFIDSANQEVRLEGARAAAELGILDRIVYNSLGSGTTEEELIGIREAGVRSAVLLAFSPRELGVRGKIYLLENGHDILEEGLIDLASRYGIDMPLLDMAVMSMDQSAGSALRAMLIAKAKWGIPSGCALHNAVESWDPLASSRAGSGALYRNVDMASTIAPIMSGADFLLFGPLEAAERSLYAAAFTDELMRQASMDL